MNDETLVQQVGALRRDLDRLLILVDGDEGLDIRGLRDRMEDLEKVADQIRDFRNLMRGIGIGLALTSMGTVGILAKLFGLIGGG